MLAFYIGWTQAGLVIGIVAATLVAFAAYPWERRQAGSGLTAAIGFSIALVQALAGSATGSVFVNRGVTVQPRLCDRVTAWMTARLP